MSLGAWKKKLARYIRTYGLGKSVQRIMEISWLKLFDKPDVIYYADLSSFQMPISNLPKHVTIVERQSSEAMTEEEKAELDTQIGHQLIAPQLKERFDQGASVWFIQVNEKTAGMVWTLVGQTIEPFYYFMTSGDVHFFNNVVFPGYRGKGLNPYLINSVLQEMKEKKLIRAYIETNLRNVREQRSLMKTGFIPLGIAKKKARGDRQITSWQTAYQPPVEK